MSKKKLVGAWWSSRDKLEQMLPRLAFPADIYERDKWGGTAPDDRQNLAGPQEYRYRLRIDEEHLPEWRRLYAESTEAGYESVADYILKHNDQAEGSADSNRPQRKGTHE